jgi:hypothetical protein
LTPSVSSSKNLSRPALDAGNGLFFFLPLIVLSLLPRWRPFKICCAVITNQIIAQKQ